MQLHATVASLAEWRTAGDTACVRYVLKHTTSFVQVGFWIPVGKVHARAKTNQHVPASEYEIRNPPQILGILWPAVMHLGPVIKPSSSRWLLPDDRIDCNPFFVAHSLLSAIWLMWRSLPQGTQIPRGITLPMRPVSSHEAPREPPPSAQKPPKSTTLSAKRAAPASELSTPKRLPVPGQKPIHIPTNQRLPLSQSPSSPFL